MTPDTPRRKERHVSDNGATAIADQATDIDEEAGTTEKQSHPGWCDPERCTMTVRGGAHHSAWVTLGPLPPSNLVVRAYVFATDDAPDPLLMVSFHNPIDHPEDIAHNAGVNEDTAPCLVLPPDQVIQISGFLNMIAAVSHGMVMPRSTAPRRDLGRP
jgi:hypothetical protein